MGQGEAHPEGHIWPSQVSGYTCSIDKWKHELKISRCSSSALKMILRSRSPLECHEFFVQALLWEEFKETKDLAWEAQLAPHAESSAPIVRVLCFPAVLAGFQGHLLGWISTCVCGVHAFPPCCTSTPLLRPSNTTITQRSTSSAQCRMQAQGGKILACWTFQAGDRQWTETACPRFMNKRLAVPLWIGTG